MVEAAGASLLLLVIEGRRAVETDPRAHSPFILSLLNKRIIKVFLYLSSFLLP